MDGLLKLAERCEAAAGPDKDLALAINDAFRVAACSDEDGDPTVSLDAAIALVIEGAIWDVASTGSAWVMSGDELFTGKAANPALALCAAELRRTAGARK